MQTLGEILSLEGKTTPTKTSDAARGEKAEHSVMQAFALSAAADFGQPPKQCDVCGEAMYKDMEIQGILRRLPSPCKCRRDRIKENERLAAEDVENNFKRHLDRFKAYSLMDGRFELSTFENWIDKGDNRELYELGKKYCENWHKVFAENYGLLLYGNAGSGKTYLAFAIANELYSMGKSVMAISVSAILTAIKDSFGNQNGIAEAEVMRAVGDVSLLILDDFGIEYRTGWAYEKLYAIIDRRYRSGKPLIITTNLSKEELRDNLKLMDGKSGQEDVSERIYDRIVEMCQFEEIKGKSWRAYKHKQSKAKFFSDLGIRSS